MRTRALSGDCDCGPLPKPFLLIDHSMKETGLFCFRNHNCIPTKSFALCKNHNCAGNEEDSSLPHQHLAGCHIVKNSLQKLTHTEVPETTT
jgi:hypothetical protein